MPCIVLIGPMGAGKTTLGKKLAKALSLPFSDTDRIVESVHGSITRIFETLGEEKFRDYEEQALAQALAGDGVIATGGGIILRERNRNALRGHTVVFLDTNSDSVLKRVNLVKRPLLKNNPEKWNDIYESRLPLYRELGHLTVFTGNRPIKAILEELTDKVNQHGK